MSCATPILGVDPPLIDGLASGSGDLVMQQDQHHRHRLDANHV